MVPSVSGSKYVCYPYLFYWPISGTETARAGRVSSIWQQIKEGSSSQGLMKHVTHFGSLEIVSASECSIGGDFILSDKRDIFYLLGPSFVTVNLLDYEGNVGTQTIGVGRLEVGRTD